MRDIELKVPEQSPEATLELFEKEIEDFSNFMATVADWRAGGPLNRGERALLKTYLVHKHRGRF